jgi:hypothetical protein
MLRIGQHTDCPHIRLAKVAEENIEGPQADTSFVARHGRFANREIWRLSVIASGSAIPVDRRAVRMPLRG